MKDDIATLEGEATGNILFENKWDHISVSEAGKSKVKMASGNIRRS